MIFLGQIKSLRPYWTEVNFVQGVTPHDPRRRGRRKPGSAVLSSKVLLRDYPPLSPTGQGWRGRFLIVQPDVLASGQEPGDGS